MYAFHNYPDGPFIMVEGSRKKRAASGHLDPTEYMDYVFRPLYKRSFEYRLQYARDRIRDVM